MIDPVTILNLIGEARRDSATMWILADYLEEHGFPRHVHQSVRSGARWLANNLDCLDEGEGVNPLSGWFLKKLFRRRLLREPLMVRMVDTLTKAISNDGYWHHRVDGGGYKRLPWTVFTQRTKPTPKH